MNIRSYKKEFLGDFEFMVTRNKLGRGLVKFKGPLGEYFELINEKFAVVTNRREILFHDLSSYNSFKTVLENGIIGVTTGFFLVLYLKGMQYNIKRVLKTGILFNLGYSHRIFYKIPQGVYFKGDKRTKRITLFGCDKRRVAQVATEIRNLRRLDSYKGKGVLFEGEEIRLKAGKQKQR